MPYIRHVALLAKNFRHFAQDENFFNNEIFVNYGITMLCTLHCYACEYTTCSQPHTMHDLIPWLDAVCQLDDDLWHQFYLE